MFDVYIKAVLSIGIDHLSQYNTLPIGCAYDTTIYWNVFAVSCLLYIRTTVGFYIRLLQ